jgi:flagellar P-ring protein precursor FlgI
MFLMAAAIVAAQPAKPPSPPKLDPKADLAKWQREKTTSPGFAAAAKTESTGIEVRIKDIARFRGVRGNQLVGYGLVIGLEGTGDTKKTPFTATLLANALKDFGTVVDPLQLNPKNIAAVAITAELPPFASPGNPLDVTVQSIGDAKSLQGGYLLQAPLYGPIDKIKAIAVAQGALSIGGFNFGSNGSSVQKNFTTVGRIPAGAFVEASVPTQVLFDGHLFLELDEADLTTSKRIAEGLGKTFPELLPRAIDGGTIELTLPKGASPVETMSKVELSTVFADIEALVVVNERTGTIAIGGNVRLGPAVIAHGDLQISIQQDLIISQPQPFSKTGETVVAPESTVAAQEARAQVALIPPNTSVNDLAKIFQALKVSPRDIISILQALKEQGSLKARIKVQ